MRRKFTDRIPLIRPIQILPAIREEDEEEYKESKKQILISNLNKKKNEFPILNDRVRFLQDKVLEIQEKCLYVKEQIVEQKIELKTRAFAKHIKEILELTSSSSSNKFLLK